jgi:hypothetical protein
MKIERTSRMATNIDYPRALLALLAAAVLAAGLLAFLGAKPARAADPSFVAAPNSPFAVGSAPTTVTNVDFDNDGNMDLAAQNSSSNNVSVLLGDGDGDFQKAPNSPFAVGSTPSSVISADFNGDGKADLAVTNQNSRSVSVLLGDGTGDFQKAPNSPFTVGGASWAQPSSVISAHYNDDNADGKVDSTDFVDLAVANLESHDVSVLLGNGDGNFQAAKNFTMGSNPNQVISADFNGDNKADLVTANWGRCQPFPSCQSLNVRGGFSVRLGNGDGTFQSSMTHELDHAYSITTEDFNGDGKADLAVPLYSSKRVWVYLNKGAGIFVNWEIVATGLEANPVAVASADLDSDSKADLAVTNFASGLSDNVSVLFGSGNGSFQATKNFPTGDGPVFVVGADLTDDSRVDLAVANQDSHNVSVLLNTAVDTIAPRVVHVSPADAATEVALGTNVEASFSEAMDPNSITDQTFTLKEQGSSNPVAARVLYDGASKKATLYPAVPLEADTSYTATIKGGSSGVKDLPGNALTADKVWTFATVDTRSPAVPVITSPPDNSVDNDGDFTVSGTAEANSTVELFEGSVSRGTDIADGSGNWSIAMTGVGEGSHAYTARARDAAGNTSDPSNALTVNVEMPPVVISVSPPDQAQNVPRNTTVEATFSEAMSPSTLDASTFTLKGQGSTTPVEASVSYHEPTRTATLIPSAGLETNNTTYTATIKGGPNGARDAAGQALAADEFWTFSTVDTTAPSVPAISSPAGGSTLNVRSFTVSGTAEASSTVELFEGSVSKGTARANASGQWSIELTGVSDGSHSYKAKATDAVGNASAESEARTVTVDATQPTVSRVVPAENARGVAPGANVTAVFSEAMNADSIDEAVKLYKKGSTTALVATLTYDATAKRAVLNPSANLRRGVTYKAVVGTGVRDLAGNALDQDPSLAGNQQKAWFFTVRT